MLQTETQQDKCWPDGPRGLCADSTSTSDLSFAIETKIITLEFWHIESNTPSCARTVQKAKTWVRTALLTNARSFSGRHLMSRNAKTWKFKCPL